MLHLNTIDEGMHQLLLRFSSLKYLENFALAGGTSLSLQLGHRKSIDIDLFAFGEISMQEIGLLLNNEFEDINIRSVSKAFIFCNINSVKCDFVNHSKEKLLNPCKLVEGIRLFSTEDVAAMKMNALCGRGSKKDFYDIYILLQHYSLSQLLEFYDTKTGYDNSWMALKSLQYFEDADPQEQPELIASFPEWDEIKNFIIKTSNDYKFNV
jgi:predicted nucleotidyltransferase component of viral defense system